MTQIDTENPQPRILVIGGMPMTTSLAVAEHFDKEHFHVLRDIREIIERSDDPDFTIQNFIEFSHVTGRGKVIPCYRLTELGFSLLVMGFTGAKAARWKRAYAQAFMAMREHILQREQAAHAATAVRERALYDERNALLAENMSLRYARDRLQDNNTHLGAQVQALSMEKFLADQILTDGYSSEVAMQALVEFKELFADWVAEDYMNRRRAQEEREAVAAIKSRVDPRRAASHEMLVRLQFALNRNLNDACVAWAMLQLGAVVETMMAPRYPGTEDIDVEPLRGRPVTRRQIRQRVDEQLSAETLADALRRLEALGVVQTEPKHPMDDQRLKHYRICLTALLARIVETAERTRWVGVSDGVRGRHGNVDMFLPLDVNGKQKAGFPLQAALQPRIAPAVLPVRFEIDVRMPGQDRDEPEDEEPQLH